MSPQRIYWHCEALRDAGMRLNGWHRLLCGGHWLVCGGRGHTCTALPTPAAQVPLPKAEVEAARQAAQAAGQLLLNAPTYRLDKAMALVVVNGPGPEQRLRVPLPCPDLPERVLQVRVRGWGDAGAGGSWVSGPGAARCWKELVGGWEGLAGSLEREGGAR